MNRDKFLKQVQDAIDVAVTPLGFVRTEPDLWVRDAGWKKDNVELMRRKEIKTTFTINLDVTIPPKPGTPFEAKSIGCVNLPATAGHEYVSYRYADDPKQLIERIRTELENASTWFAQFETPAKCLQYLRTMGRVDHTLPAPRSPAYIYCDGYLSSLAEHWNVR